MRWLPLAAGLVACPGPHTDTDPDTDTDTDTTAAADVVLWRLVAQNDTGDTDEAGEHDDWLELHNRGEHVVDLGGWSLTDGYPDELPWPIPFDTALAPGASVRIWCDEDPLDGPLHADFKLAAGGETVTLLDPDGNVVDAVTWPALGPDEVYAREGEGWGVEGR